MSEVDRAGEQHAREVGLDPERPECDGSGRVPERLPTGEVLRGIDDRPFTKPCNPDLDPPGCRKCRPCETCDGRGKFYVPGDGWVTPCPDCKGSGVQPSGKEGETVSDADGREYLVPSDPPAEQPERESNVARPHELRRIARQSSSAAEQPGTEGHDPLCDRLAYGMAAECSCAGTEEGKDAAPEYDAVREGDATCPNCGFPHCRGCGPAAPSDAAGGEGPLQMVREFHETFGLPVADGPAAFPDAAERHLRVALLSEEYREYDEAEDRSDLVAVADALGDMVCVIYGTALSYGIDLDAVVAEIHRSNMTKERHPTQKYPSKNVIKGDRYQPPNLEAVLQSGAEGEALTEVPPSPAAPEGERPHRHNFNASLNCAVCGLHASVVEGGALSPEVITAHLREGRTFTISPASPPTEGRDWERKYADLLCTFGEQAEGREALREAVRRYIESSDARWEWEQEARENGAVDADELAEFVKAESEAFNALRAALAEGQER